MMISLIFLILLGGKIANSQTTLSDKFVVQDDFIRSLDYFAIQLYQKATENVKENVIISPLSVQLALTLALFGANNDTKESMLNGLSYGNLTDELLAKNFHAWMRDIQGSLSLLLAFKVYVTDQYPLLPDYEYNITSVFKSEVESIDFTQNVQSANEINSWIAKKTSNRITNLIGKKDLSTDTKIVLINTIYFNDLWLKQFSSSNTKPSKFYTNDVKFAMTDFMNMTANVDYAIFPELDATIIRLAYRNAKKMKMMILLPKARNGLARMKNKLHLVDWFQTSLNLRFKTQGVIVQIPKFSFETMIDMKSTLIKMGMEDIFSSDTADFTNIVDPNDESCNLHVDKVLHKTFISVNENGTEAAAATAVVMFGSGAPPMKFVNFLADHPFIFMLQNGQTIFFIGQVTKF